MSGEHGGVVMLCIGIFFPMVFWIIYLPERKDRVKLSCAEPACLAGYLHSKQE